MASTQHYLALRPCIELLSVGETMAQSIGGQTVLIPRGSSTIFPTSSLEVLRIGERNQSRTVSSLLLLTSGGLVVYLLYKSCTSDENSDDNSSNRSRPKRSKWSAQSWIRWLLFGDTPDLRGQYFGPSPLHHHKPPEANSLMRTSASPHNNSNIVYVSPCPNCVRGVCKIRKHHQMILRGSHHHLQFLPLWERDSASTSGTSTPVRITDFKLTVPNTAISGSPRDSESADDEGSGNEETTPAKLSTPSKKRKSNRIPPEGRERHSIEKSSRMPLQSSRMTRDDESMDSIVGVSGDMVDLVKGAREVRRLIREASFDSLASEFSLDLSLHDGIGGQTASNFDSLVQEIDDLKDNCDDLNDSMSTASKIKSSKSENQFFSKESTPSEFASSPDLKGLHKIIHSAPRSKALWTLTHATGFSDNDSTYSPIHRETSASPIFHDTKEPRYKVALSSNASECGEWEWDSEGLCETSCNPDLSQQVYHHDTWLQDDLMELDLEAELLTSTFNRCSRNSCHSTTSEIDTSNLYNRIRLPPSGRSSAMSISGLHEGPIPTTLSRSSSTGSFKEYSTHRKHKQRMVSSDESGIDQGLDKSMTSSDFSMISSVTTPLSPVHEVRESPKHQNSTYHTPMATNTKTTKTLPTPLTSSRHTPKSALESTREREQTRRRIFSNP